MAACVWTLCKTNTWNGCLCLDIMQDKHLKWLPVCGRFARQTLEMAACVWTFCKTNTWNGCLCSVYVDPAYKYISPPHFLQDKHLKWLPVYVDPALTTFCPLNSQIFSTNISVKTAEMQGAEWKNALLTLLRSPFNIAEEGGIFWLLTTICAL